jgi:peptidoglycan/xylan/chitin deacetylase (PgdA/CDA1 family)
VSPRLLVLGWHNVESSWLFPVRPGAGVRGLGRQLAFLRRRMTVVPLGDALRALSQGQPLPPRAVAVTFDDGYRDTLELAVPILERLGLPATFFLVPELLSGLIRPWWEMLGWAFTCSRRESIRWEGQQLGLRGAAERRASLTAAAERLKQRPVADLDRAVTELRLLCDPSGAPGHTEMFLDWQGARELVRRGFTVGSHSLKHTILAREGAAEQHRDLLLSRQQLEHRLGVTVDLLAYPNGLPGDYDATTIRAARDAGYAYAVTTNQGWNRAATPPYEIRRFVQQPQRGVAGLALAPLQATRSRLSAAVPRLASRGRRRQAQTDS